MSEASIQNPSESRVAATMPSARSRADARPIPWSLRAGSILGVDVYVHVTFTILLAWVAFSHLAEGHGLRAAVDGVVLVLSVFGVVVLHELGHALVARRFGIRTRDIILLPIGGVARLDRIPERPREELLVAIAGPAVNVVLALVFAAAILMAGGAFDPAAMNVVGGPLITKLLWVNVALAGFNMLPAFPMDGGRILRAALASRMDRVRATEVAARIGQQMAILLGVVGLFAAPILLFTAVFVWIGAQQESSFVQTKAALRGMPVRRAMATDLRTLEPSVTIGGAAATLLAGFQHDFPVVHEGRLLGVLTRRDIVEGLAAGRAEAPVADAMHTDVATADVAEPLDEALGRMTEHSIDSVPVLENGRFVGMLAPENIGELVLMSVATRSAPKRLAGPHGG